MAIQRTPELLWALLESKVDFVILGGVAAIAHGSAAFTLEFEIAAPLSATNLSNLLKALAPFHPRHALAEDQRPVTESLAELAKNKNLCVMTDLGRLDVVSEVPPVGDFEILSARALRIEVMGHPCRVISLDDLIATKAHLGREKDRAVELELRAIRDRIRAKPP